MFHFVCKHNGLISRLIHVLTPYLSIIFNQLRSLHLGNWVDFCYQGREHYWFHFAVQGALCKGSQTRTSFECSSPDYIQRIPHLNAECTYVEEVGAFLKLMTYFLAGYFHYCMARFTDPHKPSMPTPWRLSFPGLETRHTEPQIGYGRRV